MWESQAGSRAGKPLSPGSPHEPQCWSPQRGLIPQGSGRVAVSPGHRAWSPLKGRALYLGVLAGVQKKKNLPTGDAALRN